VTGAAPQGLHPMLLLLLLLLLLMRAVLPHWH
jgi:hypothetical protein